MEAELRGKHHRKDKEEEAGTRARQRGGNKQLVKVRDTLGQILSE